MKESDFSFHSLRFFLGSSLLCSENFSGKIKGYSLVLLYMIPFLLCCATESKEEEKIPPTKRIFITSGTYSGMNLSGLSDADAKCQTHADAANLGGTFKAWLSDSNTNAIDCIQDVGPWYWVDGKTIVINNKANLATNPVNPVKPNEHGATVSNPWVATVTLYSGIKSDKTCMNWGGTTNSIQKNYSDLRAETGDTNPPLTNPTIILNGLYGCGLANISTWTESASGSSTFGCGSSSYPESCSVALALYCLEQ